jgi:hypothetical protein
MHFPMHAVLHMLPMRLPTHACLRARKPCCIVVRGPIPLAAVIKARDCGGRLGSCHGLVVGPSCDNAIAAAHSVGLASLPLLHLHCCLHHNWHLPCPDTVATLQRTWRCCPFLLYTNGFVTYPALCHGDLAFGSPSGVVLVSLPALHWCPCPQCTGVIASIALSLSPALFRHCCLCCAGIFTLIVLA